MLILGAMEWQRHMINKELVRIDPALAIRAEAGDDAPSSSAAQTSLAEVSHAQTSTRSSMLADALCKVEVLFCSAIIDVISFIA